MLDLLRPVAQLARPLRPTGGHDFARGSLGLKRGVGAASGGASCAAPTKNVTNVGGARRIFAPSSARDVSSFSRGRSPFGSRTRTTQEKPISESYEVTAPRGQVRT